MLSEAIILSRYRALPGSFQLPPSPSGTATTLILTAGPNTSYFLGPSIPAAWPPYEVEVAEVQGGILEVAPISEAGTLGVWASYSTGQRVFPLEEKPLADLRFAIRAPGGAAELRLSVRPKPIPAGVQLSAQGEDLATFTWTTARPGYWAERGEENEIPIYRYWRALFRPLDKFSDIAAGLPSLLDPQTAPLAFLEVVERIAAPPQRLREILPEAAYRKLLKHSRWLQQHRGLPTVYKPLFAIAGLTGGVFVEWDPSVPNRRRVYYGGEAPLSTLVPLLRAYTPASIEILLSYSIGYPAQTDYSWTEISWTFSEAGIQVIV